jgi:hypothetical protein
VCHSPKFIGDNKPLEVTTISITIDLFFSKFTRHARKKKGKKNEIELITAFRRGTDDF